MKSIQEFREFDPVRYGDSSHPIFYVVDWLPPDFGAVGQYAVIFAQEFARSGRTVYLIGLTSKGATATVERIGTGVLETRKIESPTYDKSRALKRLSWTIITNFRLMREVIRNPASKRATVLFTGSPPFMLFFAFLAKVTRNVRLVYRITDFFPEVIIADRGKQSIGLWLLQRIVWFLRRRIDTFEALGLDQAALLTKGGVAHQRIVLKRYRSPVRLTGSESPLPLPKELRGRRVLLYSGNFGVAHEADTLVQGLIRHHRVGSDQFALWLNASGSKVYSVAQELKAAEIPFKASAPVDLEKLPALLAAADVHLITLRQGFSGVVLPSKIYACIQSAKAILFVGPASSDVHLLCSQASDTLYERVEPGDVVGFSAALDRLSGMLADPKSKQH